MHRTKGVFIVLLVLAFFGAVLLGSRLSTEFSPENVSDEAVTTEFREFEIGSEVLRVEVVRTPAAITKGLGGRDTIGSEGMLFVFEEPRVATFWMKDMRFNIDLVWITDERVVGVVRDMVAPGKGMVDSVSPRYTSPEPVDMVLEIPTNAAFELGIEPGMPARLRES